MAAANNNSVDKRTQSALRAAAKLDQISRVPMAPPQPRMPSEEKGKGKEVENWSANLFVLVPRDLIGEDEQVERSEIPDPEHEDVWSSLPFDLKENILQRCLFKDVYNFHVAVGKDSSNVPYNIMKKIPADTTPLLLHLDHCDKTFRFYDPLNNVTFEIERPDENISVGRLCDFWHQQLVTARSDGVALMNIRTGKEFLWEVSTGPSDSYIISRNGHRVNAVLGTKGEDYNTIVAILQQRKDGKPCKKEVAIRTEVPFTVSPLTNPILRGNKLICLSTERQLGEFDLENKVATIYIHEEQEDNHEDNEEDDSDDDEDDDDNSDASGDDDKFYLNIFKNPAVFLCAKQDELFIILMDEGWETVQVKKLDETDMTWQDVNSLGDEAIFTGTRCSFITTVPSELQNKVILPGYYKSPLLVKAELTASDGRFFFEPKEIMEMGSTSSSGGEVSHGKRSDRVELQNSLWIQLNSFQQ